MSVVDKLKEEIRSDEGWDAFPYDDHLGFKTIGYGFLIDKRKGGGLPRPVAEFWLTYIINGRISDLTRSWPAFTRQPEEIQLVLLNMSYQLGVGGVLNFKKMLLALERGDRAEAKVQALDSTWAKQTPKRAQRLADILAGS